MWVKAFYQMTADIQWRFWAPRGPGPNELSGALSNAKRCMRGEPAQRTRCNSWGVWVGAVSSPGVQGLFMVL